MTRVRILLTNLPRMLRDILTGAVRGEPDMELVEGDRDPTRSAGAAVPCVVVASRTAEAAALFRTPPPAGKAFTVVLVSPAGRDAELFEVIRRPPVRNLSPQRLLAVARDLAREADPGESPR